MSRTRTYSIECDMGLVAECAGDIWGAFRKDVEQEARRDGWLLGSRVRGDVCPHCRDTDEALREAAREDPEVARYGDV